MENIYLKDLSIEELDKEKEKLEKTLGKEDKIYDVAYKKYCDCIKKNIILKKEIEEVYIEKFGFTNEVINTKGNIYRSYESELEIKYIYVNNIYNNKIHFVEIYIEQFEDCDDEICDLLEEERNEVLECNDSLNVGYCACSLADFKHILLDSHYQLLDNSEDVEEIIKLKNKLKIITL